jgi:endonuclease-3 related protein
LKKILKSIYKKLFFRFGPQGWWPADDRFEVIIGAILTQNTNWGNVEKAISNIKNKKLLTPQKLYCLSSKKLASLIRPAGYYNIKTKRLKSFLKFFFESYGGDIRKLTRADRGLLREDLLCVNGIGEETADSILLYALEKPIFVIDAYTRRIFLRYGLIKDKYRYVDIQNLLMRSLKADVKLFNEYHALLVKLGKEYCLKNRPRCRICPLFDSCEFGSKRNN